MSKKPTVLMILDGYGLNDKHEANAVFEGKTPVMDKLMAEYPFVKGNASGMAVGLPEGQMGNSEVGHLNMGAGRIVYQDLTKITKAIQDGDFFENEALLEARFSAPYVRTGFRRWSTQPQLSHLWIVRTCKKTRAFKSLCTLFPRWT